MPRVDNYTYKVFEKSRGLNQKHTKSDLKAQKRDACRQKIEPRFFIEISDSHPNKYSPLTDSYAFELMLESHFRPLRYIQQRPS